MPSLPDELFSILENKTLKARESAEKAARNIAAYLKVESSAWWGEKDDPQRSLWLGLRARARQLGYAVENDAEKDPVKRGLPLLVEEIAYEQWHRMLFARFLAENHLLMHPSGVAVSLAECEELAPEEGEDDAWRLAARYASAMLPGIFKQEDPCAQVRLTPSDHHTLENILLEIPVMVFTCDDALGWMYQFWQSKKKDEVNASERKIGGADISPVTQLFTEDYMVRFLLENTLGAWWAARHPHSSLVKEWEYLRLKDDDTPAAGSFPGWPDRAAEVTVMDPCCGSGHFLLAAFDMLRRMRMEEEGLDASTAARCTLKDNIFGLEIDQRCTQIAWFALSLVGWKSGGYQSLPELNITCTGIPVKGQLSDWLALAGDDSRVKAGLERLYNLFKDAHDLGSLINPTEVPLVDRMFVADYEQVTPAFEKAIRSFQAQKDNQRDFLHFTANDTLKAVKYLNKTYTLVTTNVPYLGRSKQSPALYNHCELYYPYSKSDLATVFIERCKDYTSPNGTYALVVPQNWTFLVSYKDLRKQIIQKQEWNLLARLGPQAFRTPMYDFNVALIIISNNKNQLTNQIIGIDASPNRSIEQKANDLISNKLSIVDQKSQLLNPDVRIIFEIGSRQDLLGKYVIAPQGIKTGDDSRYRRNFWELQFLGKRWRFYQSTPTGTEFYDGMSFIIDWGEEGKNLARRQGQSAWGKKGIAVGQMSNLPKSLYLGDIQDSNINVIIPKKQEDLNAIYCFLMSDEFRRKIRSIDQKISVTNSSMTKVGIDISYWREFAQKSGDLPDPVSEDLTQWLFSGDIPSSTNPLQVALLRFMGYRWPQQKSDYILDFTVADSIVCLLAIYGEASASERLRGVLATVYGSNWSGNKQEELLAGVGYSGKDLADWLRDGFFEQHCRLFQNRPFIWHIWDGRKDGFSALVNYHKLDRANLEKLTYTYLGAWITDRKKELERGAAGAEGRLLAAQALQDKLKLILAGEPPYDIYVRWKPLHEQPMGWEPDLNDGVRLNIRPFVTAGVLRSKFTINWNKDRGKNPDGSERLNDLHFTIAEKRAAREKKRK